jgi:carbonic anhydrase
MSSPWQSLLAAHEAVRDPSRSTAPPHAPTAAVLACSDARVPPSVVFDQPAGSLFVVRVAGNTATPAAVASLDYAVEQLGVELVLVLGHTNCGAVAAACAGSREPYLEPLTTTIRELVEHDECHDPEQLAERNVVGAVADLSASRSPVGAAIRAGSVMIQGAVYDLATDDVRPLAPNNPQPSVTVQKEQVSP